MKMQPKKLRKDMRKLSNLKERASDAKKKRKIRKTNVSKRWTNTTRLWLCRSRWSERSERNDAMNLSNEISSSGPLTIKIIDLYRVRNRSSTKMRQLSLSLAISKD